MYISEVCRPVGNVLKSFITKITLVGLQAEMTVQMTAETDRVAEGSSAV